MKLQECQFHLNCLRHPLYPVANIHSGITFQMTQTANVGRCYCLWFARHQIGQLAATRLGRVRHTADARTEDPDDELGARVVRGAHRREVAQLPATRDTRSPRRPLSSSGGTWQQRRQHSSGDSAAAAAARQR